MEEELEANGTQDFTEKAEMAENIPSSDTLATIPQSKLDDLKQSFKIECTSSKFG